ncbi:MAG: threonine/serine dehydratase [Rhodospirillaceae bacterium]|nr:threonine/serine dehydratase [Rhodospirillaceae bacterium]
MDQVQGADTAPELAEIREARALLGNRVLTTPVHPWRGGLLERLVPAGTEVWAKLELLQVTGTFKPRGALLATLALDEDTRRRGIVAVSAGNHAIAAAFTAASLGISAKVVMIRTASPLRVRKCRDYGAEVILTDTIGDAFATVARIAEEEGRTSIHPFEGRWTNLGTATLGLEFMEQVPGLEAVVVPIGGGGLIAGVANAVKRVNPACQVLGVEPFGADTITRSLAAGAPQTIDKVTTIADSLGAPLALPYSFGLIRRFVDEVVRVDDDALREAMALIFQETKFAVEPAGAAATAALIGPLRERLAGARVGLVFCGTNIDLDLFHTYASAGREMLERRLGGPS